MDESPATSPHLQESSDEETPTPSSSAAVSPALHQRSLAPGLANSPLPLRNPALASVAATSSSTLAFSGLPQQIAQRRQVAEPLVSDHLIMSLKSEVIMLRDKVAKLEATQSELTAKLDMVLPLLQLAATSLNVLSSTHTLTPAPKGQEKQQQ